MGIVAIGLPQENGHYGLFMDIIEYHSSVVNGTSDQGLGTSFRVQGSLICIAEKAEVPPVQNTVVIYFGSGNYFFGFYWKIP